MKTIPTLVCMSGLSGLLALGCQSGSNPAPTHDTAVQKDWGVWPSHVEVDSFMDPVTNEKVIRLTPQDPIGWGTCSEGNIQARYIGIEFEQPIPGGTVVEAAVPEGDFAFADTLPTQCEGYHTYWIMLPDDWASGQSMDFRTNTNNVIVADTRSDGIVIIANIDEEDVEPTRTAVPMSHLNEQVKRGIKPQ